MPSELLKFPTDQGTLCRSTSVSMASEQLFLIPKISGPFFFLDGCSGEVSLCKSQVSPVALFRGLFSLWSAICFKIMTRYTCGFFPRILAIIHATRYTCVFLSRILAFYSQVYDYFVTNAYIYAHKKAHIYALQTSMWYMGSQKVVV